MLEGLDWVLALQREYDIKIVNISVGIGNLREWEKEWLLQKKIEDLWYRGILVVCAAGNKGPKEGSISAVGGKCVVTVGCYDGSFSRGNPRSCERYSGRGIPGSPVRKPDLVAPGVDIMTTVPGGGYGEATGTSFATPFVTGAAALLMEWGITDGNDPFLYGEKVKAYLQKGARALPAFSEYPNPVVGEYGIIVPS